MNAVIHPGKLKGTVIAPPSKSMAHRLLICMALADGCSRIHGIDDSEDILATVDCLNALGMKADKQNGVLTVSNGITRDGEEAVLPCRESGSTMRFLLPLAAVLRDRVTVTGSRRLIERGISAYEDLFQANGIRVTITENEIRTEGRLNAGAYTLPGNISSQFVSGLLIALSVCEEESRLSVLPPVESRPYIDMTASVLNQYGADIRREDDHTYLIRGGTVFHATEIEVEGDWSNASAFYAMNRLGHEITVTGTNPDSLQGDKNCVPYLELMSKEGMAIDLSDTPDLGPILFAAAAAGTGGKFNGTRRLALKESNRTQVMITELAKFGIHGTVDENSVTIFPGTIRKPETLLDGHGDHRIVMALTALCSLTGGTITGAEAVNKSYPEFFDMMWKLGMRIDFQEET